MLDLVSGLVSLGLAQCILGNHEFNLLRQEQKEGNGWYFETNHDHAENKFLDSRPLDSGKRLALRDFLAGLPLLWSAMTPDSCMRLGIRRQSWNCDPLTLAR